MKSFKELVLEAWKDGSWVADVPPQKTKGSRYSGEEYEKEAELPVKKPEAAEPAEKRGRGRPTGSVSQDTKSNTGMAGADINKIIRGEFEKRTLKGVARKVKGWAQSGSRKDDVDESLDENISPVEMSSIANSLSKDAYKTEESADHIIARDAHILASKTHQSAARKTKDENKKIHCEHEATLHKEKAEDHDSHVNESLDESKLLTFKLQHKQQVQSAVAGIGHSSFDDRDGHNIRYDAKDEPKIKQALAKAGMNPFNDNATSSDKVRTRDYEGVGLGLAAKKKADMEKKNAAKRAKTAAKKTNEEVDLDEMTMGAQTSSSGKKVEWIHHPGIGHSITVNGAAVHQGFLEHKDAAKVFAKHLSEDSISESLMRKVVDKLDIAHPGTPYHKIAKDIVKDTFSEPKQTAKDAWDLVKKAAAAIHSPIKSANARYESTELDEDRFNYVVYHGKSGKIKSEHSSKIEAEEHIKKLDDKNTYKIGKRSGDTSFVTESKKKIGEYSSC